MKAEENKSGIFLAGNILADIVKTIDSYPEIGMLSNIKSVNRAVGGCVPNTGIDIAKIDPTVPIKCFGCIGKDDYGNYVKSVMDSYGIDTGSIVYTEKQPTSFSDVMNLASGERTFFHARGANTLFSPDDINIDELDCKILHTGYILLLDKFDETDPEYGTAMARFLHDVQMRGIKTSVDVVSDNTGDYPNKIKPALKYCDYIIFNEIECCNIWGISPTANGKTDFAAIKRAMQLTMNAGVKEKVIVHCKEAGFVLDKSGNFTFAPSLNIPKEEIKGSVGAGDAFCAGALYSLYCGYDDKRLLLFSSAAAACNLFSENSIDGMQCRSEIEKMDERFGRKEIDFGEV